MSDALCTLKETSVGVFFFFFPAVCCCPSLADCCYYENNVSGHRQRQPSKLDLCVWNKTPLPQHQNPLQLFHRTYKHFKAPCGSKEEFQISEITFHIRLKQQKLLFPQ